MASNELDMAIEGDREALNSVFLRCHDRIRRFAQTRLGDGLHTRVHTSDILQSTYLEVVRGIGSFQGESEDEFASWVCRIMENNLRDKSRYFNAKKRNVGKVLDIDQVAVEAIGEEPSDAASALESASLIMAAMNRLSPDQRRVYTLRIFEGHDHREISEITGKSELAVRSLFSRARAAMALEVDRLRKSGDSK